MRETSSSCSPIIGGGARHTRLWNAVSDRNWMLWESLSRVKLTPSCAFCFLLGWWRIDFSRLCWSVHGYCAKHSTFCDLQEIPEASVIVLLKEKTTFQAETRWKLVPSCTIVLDCSVSFYFFSVILQHELLERFFHSLPTLDEVRVSCQWKDRRHGVGCLYAFWWLLIGFEVFNHIFQKIQNMESIKKPNPKSQRSSISSKIPKEPNYGIRKKRFPSCSSQEPFHLVMCRAWRIMQGCPGDWRFFFFLI